MKEKGWLLGVNGGGQIPTSARQSDGQKTTDGGGKNKPPAVDELHPKEEDNMLRQTVLSQGIKLQTTGTWKPKKGLLEVRGATTSQGQGPTRTTSAGA